MALRTWQQSPLAPAWPSIVQRVRRRLKSTAWRPALLAMAALPLTDPVAGEIGQEVAVSTHLADGQEVTLPLGDLIAHGQTLFEARWTVQEGAGRPFTTGTGDILADPASPLLFPRNFNRVSGPDSNACAGCHNLPRTGGAGDAVANVFVLGQRFDFASFDAADVLPRRGGLDENGRRVSLGTIANERATVGMFGSGYVEMLARQITADLRAQRDALGPGQATELVSSGVAFGRLARRTDGSWDASSVEGLPSPSLQSSGPDEPPSLVIRPFHQAGAVVSLRQFSNNAFNHHHGIQSVERFGDEDPDGDGFHVELTRADVTAVTVFQATLPVPGRMIPRDPRIERAVLEGESLFMEIGCAACHVPEMELSPDHQVYSEPNPYNPPGNLRPGEAPELRIRLNSRKLPLPRLTSRRGRVLVPVYSDFKLHDITRGPDDPNCEPLDMHHPPGSPEFLAGNCRFLTRRLWGAASEPPYFHHGKFTTLREAVEAHHGAAGDSRDAWDGLSDAGRDAVIEFLKSLQILPPGTRHTVVDETGRMRHWPPRD